MTKPNYRIFSIPLTLLLLSMILLQPISASQEDATLVFSWVGSVNTGMAQGKEVPLDGVGVYTGFVSTFTDDPWARDYPGSFHFTFSVDPPWNESRFTIPINDYNLTGQSSYYRNSIPLNTSALFTFNITQQKVNYTVWAGGSSYLVIENLTPPYLWTVDVDFSFNLTIIKGDIGDNLTLITQLVPEYVTVTQNVTQYVEFWNTSYIFYTVTETLVQYMPLLGDPSIWLSFTGSMFAVGTIVIYRLWSKNQKSPRILDTYAKEAFEEVFSEE